MTKLWIEKYRPTCINEVIGQDNIVYLLQKMSENNYLPNMLFYGKSGTGKTSLIHAILKNFYKSNNIFTVMKLDASDDRGINTVRDEIKGFAEKLSLFPNKVKIIILDEADSMTFDAQSALKRIIEKHIDTTKFCFICNYENKIIPAIKNRCINLKFNIIKKELVFDRLKYIAKQEKLIINNSSLDIIATIGEGDLRKSINILQSVNNNKSNISIKKCYKMIGIPSFEKLEYLLDILLENKQSLNSIYTIFKKSIINQGYSLSIYLKQTIKILIDKKLDNISDDKLCYILNELAKLEENVSKTTFGDIYILALICIFKKN